MIINMLPKHLMTEHKMDPTAKRLFLELLRSGEIKQSKGALNQDGCMCAEGGEWKSVMSNVLSHLNDALGLTFEQIADLVEEQW